MHLHRPAAALLLLGFALQSPALTIGRPQGSAWIGKPLDMVIPLSLDQSEGGGSLCLEAEVLQGDSRIDDKRVTVSLEPGGSPGSSRAHVRSTVAIDEPVVTVTLRAGCDTKSIRRFVMFADLPVDTPAVLASASLSTSRFESASGSAGNGPSASLPSIGSGASNNRSAAEAATGISESIPQPPPRRAPAPRTPRPPSDVAAARPAPTPAPPPRARVAAEAPTVRPPVRAPAPRVAASAPVPTPPPRAAASSASAGSGSRLQIDALEPTPNRAGPTVNAPAAPTSPTLALPGAAATLPALTASAPLPAVVAPVVAPPSEESMREAQRLQALETTLNTLREQTTQNQRTLVALRSELADARDGRFRNPLVYALIGLLLLALIAMAMMWRALRRATAPAWWGDGPPPTRSQFGALQGGRAVAEDDADEVERKRADSPSRIVPGSTFAPLAPLDEAEEEAIKNAPAPTPIAVALAHPAQRLVNTEELFDVQQQSDFFLSLGQHDQAIAVLREHISANPGTSALAYLDLLKIYHSLGRREDYDRLRQDFSTNFNAGVPDFEHFDEAGRGLEHYRGALERIEAQWPTSGTLPLIEELVFRRPGNRDEDSFDLAAYRELLLLYSVAKEVIDPDSAPPAPVTPLSYADTHFHSQLASEPAPLNVEPATRPAALLAPEHPEFGEDTQPAPLDTYPAALDDEQPMPSSLFGELEDGLQEQTVMAPDLPAAGPVEPPPSRPGREIDFTEADRTAYETLPTPLEELPSSKSASQPENDPNSIDFDLFDPSTEAEIAPRKTPKKP